MDSVGISTLAVVVTYNRSAMLMACLAALQKQTVPCHVLVVDNASTDGTAQAIAPFLDDGVFYHCLPTNLGGAGGFNFGMHWGMERGYDNLWVMDDDCIPDPTALEALVDADAVLGNYGWLSSSARWTDGNLCTMNIQRKNPYQAIKDFNSNLVQAQMASFVSLFLPRKTLETYGYPIAEFFLWTDDWEYTRRISRAIPCWVVSSSQVLHAMKNNTTVNIATDTPDRLGRYTYFYRNDVYLYRREGVLGMIWLLAKDVYHTVQVLAKVPRGQRMARIRIIWQGFAEGLRFHPVVESGEM